MKNEPFRKWLNGCTRNAGKSSKLSEARNKFANSSAIGGKDATEYTQKSSFGAQQIDRVQVSKNEVN